MFSKIAALRRGSVPERIWMAAAMNLLIGPSISVCRCEKPVEAAPLVQLVKIVATADMDVADEYLREGRASAGPLDHLLAQLGRKARIVLDIRHALLVQQPLCC